MFSMTSAAELRQRAEKQQQDTKEQDGEVVNNDAATGKGEPMGISSSAGIPEAASSSSASGDAANGSGGATPGGVKEQLSPGAEQEKDEDGGGGEQTMTEEQIGDFFRNTIAKLTSPEEREQIKANVTAEVRIPALLIKIQHGQLEAMGIEKTAGQAALNLYSRTVAVEKKEAHDKMEEFTHACQRTYIEVLREIQPGEAETEAKMLPSQIMEFFEACDTLMALPETKGSLREEFLESENPPDQTIVGMQRSMLRTLGFDPDHGISCLNSFAEDHPDDERLQQRLQQFMRCASMARQEAVMGKEEMTKRMQQQQMTAMKEHKMATELQALDAEGQAELARRVAEVQKKHAVAVMTLTTPEERAAYVKGIPEAEQWEIAKLRMLTMHMQAQADGGHGHSHAHGQPCTGHDHGGHGHGHGHAHPPPPPGEGSIAQASGHSHNHEHGAHCSHDHNHNHAKSA